jgi:type III secretion protein Q
VSAPVRVRPFPWGALDTTTRAEASVLRDLRRWVAAHTNLERLPVVLGELVGAAVEVRVRHARPLTQPQGPEGWVAVALASADAPKLERAVVVEVDAPLAATLVTRALRRKPPVVVSAGAAPSAGLLGGVAAILAAALRRAHGEAPTRVLAAGPAPALERDLARTGQEIVVVTLTVLVGDDAFAARVLAPRSALLGLPLVPWGADPAAALGPIPIALPIVACTVTTTAAELATLGPGDALMVAVWPLARSSSRPGVLTGKVLLAAPASDVGIEAQLVDDGRLVLGGDLAPLRAAQDAEKGGEMDRSAFVEAIGDVPIVVRVEVGEAQMTAREWATLGRGDVVALGRRVGEQVVLRVGGVAVARGELVELDGEIGVRIVERLAGAGK